MSEEETKLEEAQEEQIVPSLEEELAEYKDKYVRLLAESENARKRLQKERQDMTRFASESAICDFLDPIDRLENALKFAQNMSDEVKNWAIGFEMILGQFKDVLAQNGVTAIASEGKMFNPHLHEAVEVEHTEEHPEGTIIKEFVKGYQKGDRVLRNARVKVAKAPQKVTEETKEEEKQDDEEE